MSSGWQGVEWWMSDNLPIRKRVTTLTLAWDSLTIDTRGFQSIRSMHTLSNTCTDTHTDTHAPSLEPDSPTNRCLLEITDRDWPLFNKGQRHGLQAKAGNLAESIWTQHDTTGGRGALQTANRIPGRGHTGSWPARWTLVLKAWELPLSKMRRRHSMGLKTSTRKMTFCTFLPLNKIVMLWEAIHCQVDLF